MGEGADVDWVSGAPMPIDVDIGGGIELDKGL